MRVRLFALLLIAWLCASSLAFAQSDSEKWLAVRVTSESGEPLRNACVTFVPKEGEIVLLKADKRGRVKLKNPLAQDYRVVVKIDGYEAQKREVSIDRQSETVAFTLRQSAN